MHIYLDNNATTPLDPRVLDAMLQELRGPPTNPSSIHTFGQQARRLLSNARQTCASYFQVKPEEVLFTSGGSESLNLLLRGFFTGGHWITTTLEHSAVYETIKALEKQGLQVTYLSCPSGAPTPTEIEAAIRPDTRALIFSAVNSETGIKLDLPAVAALAQRHNIPLFLDAVAAIGKQNEPLILPGVTACAISAHKFHGPKGVGALILRTKILPQQSGGPQELQRRAGTENLAGILGLAEALRILSAEQPAITAKLFHLRQRLEEGILKNIPYAQINGNSPRAANVVNFAFIGIDGESLLMQLDQAGIAVSHGSACASGAIEPSRVLREMGLGSKRARSSLRFSLSRMNTETEIDRCIEIITKIANKLPRYDT